MNLPLNIKMNQEQILIKDTSLSLSTLPLIECKNSGIHCTGVYTKEDIPKATKIIEYVGELISKEEGDKRADEQEKKSKENPKYGRVYIFDLNKKYDLPLGLKYSLLKVPDIVFQNNERARAFIKGVFDSEGSITIFSSRRKDGKVDRYPCIRIVNSDRQLIEILCKVLKEDFSIESKLAERKPRYTVIDGRICAFKKPVYVLGVYNRDGVNRFLKNIGTSIKRKLIIGGMKI